MKNVRKDSGSQSKSYSSKNSKYLQQAQKLFDENEKKDNVKSDTKSSSVQTNTPVIKKNGPISVIAVKKQSSQGRRKNTSTGTTTQNANKKVVQGRLSPQSKTTSKVLAKPKDSSEKKNKVDTEVQVKKKDASVKEEKVVATKAKIKAAITKIEYDKAQEAAKKKTLELVEELKQKNNIKTENKTQAKTVKKTASAAKNISNTNKNTQSKKPKNENPSLEKTVSSNNYDFKDLKKEVSNNKQKDVVNQKQNQVVKKEQAKVKQKKTTEPKGVVEPKEDELLLKLQEELNKKDKELISNLDLFTEEKNETSEETSVEKSIEDKPSIKSEDAELKELITKVEKKEEEIRFEAKNKEKHVVGKDKDTDIAKDQSKTVDIDNASLSSKETKSKKNKKPLTKFGKILKIIAFIGLIFFVVTSVIIVKKVFDIGFIPNKYIYIASAVLAIFTIVMLLFNKTRSKVLHIIEILFTGAIGTGFIFGSIFLTNVNNSLKALFTSEEQQATYFVLVQEKAQYNSLDDLSGKRVGLLNQNIESVQEYLKDYNLEYQNEYNVAMLNQYLNTDDESKKIEAIIVEQGIYDLLEELDNVFHKSLKKIDEFTVTNSVEVEEVDPTQEYELGDGEEETPPEAPKRNPNLLNGVNIGNSFVVYINGLDGRGNGKPYGVADVNMLVVVNPNTHKVLLVSVPRDYYVRVPGTTPGMRDKLTHAGLYGIDTSIGAMEGIFGIDINDYLQFGFNAVPIVVDSIGGIEVYSDTEFDSFHMKGWHVPKGWITLDGKKALAYSRERYAYINQGDKHRIKNQQDIVQAIIKKSVTDPQQLIKFDQILNAIDPYFNTNISYERMQKIIKQQLNSLTPWTVEKISVDGSDGYQVTASYPTVQAYVMYPYESTIVAAQQKILDVMTGK